MAAPERVALDRTGPARYRPWRMPRIHLLDETLANQIAAGEVVERPAAVVKELVENALDAGAGRVEVELLEGGRRLVRVRDDGSGMGREDATLSLQRHATSKLSTKEQLFAIATYGFRGEALPSIAAVSRFSLLTAEPGALGGTRIEVDGGRLVSVADAGAPPGTTVEVRDLFWNVPARKKFLKRASTEQAHAIEAVLRLALPRPDAGFTLREGDRTLLQLAPGEALPQRAEEALGREVRGQLLPFDAAVGGLRAHGLAASPQIAHGSAKHVWLFVNGRAVRDRALLHAVLRAYGEVLPHGRYPAALVFLEVPPAEVDVNVHPAKAEVRLADPRAAYEAIARGLAAVLAPGAWLHLGPGSQGVVPTRRYGLESTAAPGQTSGPVAPDAASAGPIDPEAAARAVRVAEAITRFGARVQTGGPEERGPWEPWARGPGAGASAWAGANRGGQGAASSAGARAGAQGELLPPEPFFRGLRYLGQLHRTYLVCEGPRGLVLIDQHAAHERINYQRLRRAAVERTGPAQPLLVPRVLQLTAAAAAQLSAAGPALVAAGLELEEFGGGSVAVKVLPALLASLDDRRLAALLADLCEELAAHGTGESLERLRDALLARAGCHASVRAHDSLAPGEAQALLDALDGTDYGARCAHGRPVVAEWGVAEIEKRFGRDYASFGHAAPPEAS